jgi:hypothetical protein
MVYRLGKQASGNNVEQKGVRRYPELFHLEAARIRTDWRKGLGGGVLSSKTVPEDSRRETG